MLATWCHIWLQYIVTNTHKWSNFLAHKFCFSYNFPSFLKKKLWPQRFAIMCHMHLNFLSQLTFQPQKCVHTYKIKKNLTICLSFCLSNLGSSNTLYRGVMVCVCIYTNKTIFIYLFIYYTIVYSILIYTTTTTHSPLYIVCCWIQSQTDFGTDMWSNFF